MMPLTDAKLKAICKAIKPSDKEQTYADGDGLFFVADGTQGTRWRYRYSFEGKRFAVILGHYPAMGLKAARVQRDEFARQVQMGTNPSLERRQQRADVKAEEKALTVEQFAQEFFAEMVKRDRKNPEPELRRWHCDILPHIGARKLEELSVEDVRGVVWKKKDEGFDQAAKLVLGSLKRFCGFAVTKGHLTHNPAQNIPSKHVAPSVSRERFLNWDEVFKFLGAVERADVHRSLKIAMKLLLLSSARVGELREARWQSIYFDKGEWHIPSENSKTKRAHIFYLSRQALALFTELKELAGESPFVLPGRWGRKPYAAPTFNNTLATVTDGLGLEKFTVHDLRRTGITLLNESGFRAEVIEVAVNHKLKGIFGTYNRAQYCDERREMAQEWADMLFPDK